jgi:error-prone DNA polymerase
MTAAPTSSPAYAELAAMSCFSFLRGASYPPELVQAAYFLDYQAVAITDRNTLAGVVQAYGELKRLKKAAREAGQPLALKLIIGARLAFADSAPDVLAYCPDREAYARLCRLLTLGGTREGGKKGDCTLSFEDLLAHSQGLLFALVPPERPDATLAGWLERLTEAAPGRTWLAARMDYGPVDGRRLETLAGLAEAARVPLLAVNDVLYHSPERRELQDVMSCIREHVTLQAAGAKLLANTERCMKPTDEMARLFRGHPDAIAETVRLASLCTFDLGELKYEYPDEPVPPGKTPQQHLEDLTWAGAAWRYPEGVPDKVRKSLIEEFQFIREQDYARYFLTVHDVVRWARDEGILCQGRGSAANSVVCYCLGVTAVNPMEVDLLFARFISSERNEPPDIDVDFEHERREEVIQYIYGRYGRHRAAICATVIHYRPRSAIREVGKAFGLSEDVTGALAGTVWGSWGSEMAREQVRQAGLDPDNPTINQVVGLANQLIGFPRHLSQHVGGFVLTQRRLDETVPIVNAAMPDRTFIEWDKDDIDELGIMKVDVLALGMLTCIQKAFALLNLHRVLPIKDMAEIEEGDEATYDMLCEADSVGVFQVESRAQMNMLPRLRPRNFYDLVVEVAIVRPGPIQGDMVHPYLRRRQGKEPLDMAGPSPEHGPEDELAYVLRKTLGVPLFQEHAMQIAITAARFTPSEADGLRRAMATFKHSGRIDVYRDKMVGGMVARGYPPDFADRCFRQIEGFGSYGFPESHAASFAKLVYVSAWLKRHHPAVFAAALLNAQPMGFYAPAQIVRDAREHHVEVLPVDVEHSQWDCTLEPGGGGLALRLGFRQIGGFSEDWATRLVEGRGAGFGDFDALVRRSGLTQAQLQKLAQADAMQSLGLDRRQALWKVRGVARAAPSPLLAALPDEEAPMLLPQMALSEQVLVDYRTTRLSLKAHPMEFLRERFAAQRVLSCRDLANGRDGQAASVAGVVLVRQRPGQGKVVFVTLEDETGVANLVILAEEVFKRYRKVVMSARLMLAEGRIQKSPEGVTHLMAYRLIDRSEELKRLEEPDLFGPPKEAATPPPVNRPAWASHPRNVRIIPASRDFH